MHEVLNDSATHFLHNKCFSEKGITSVTRFGKISQLWQKYKSLGYFFIWQTFESTLAIFRAMGQRVFVINGPDIEKSSSRLATLKFYPTKIEFKLRRSDQHEIILDFSGTLEILISCLLDQTCNCQLFSIQLLLL